MTQIPILNYQVKSRDVLIFIFSTLSIVFLGFEMTRDGDFYFYYSASSKVFTSPDLYDQLHGKNQVFDYYGSPVLTLLLCPLTKVSITVAALLWKVLSIMALYKIWRILESFSVSMRLNDSEKTRWLLVTFIGILFLVYTNLHHVQHTILLLYLSLEGVFQIEKNRAWQGALLISLGIFLKVAPIVLFPYLLYRSRYRSALLIVVFILVFASLPTLFLGWEHSYLLWEGWLSKLNPGADLNALDMNNEKNQGLIAWISTLCIEGIRHIESSVFLRRHLIDLPLNIVINIIWFL